MPFFLVKKILKFLTETGPSTKAAIVADMLTKGGRTVQTEYVIDNLYNAGKLSKTVDDYDIV